MAHNHGNTEVSMDFELRLPLRGTDAAFLGTTTTFATMLATLDIYKSAPAHLGHEQLTHHLNQYQGYYEGGKYGDRINISMRKAAREALASFCQRVLYFLQAVASEADLPILMQGGVTLRRRARRKAAQKPAAATA